MKSLIRRLPQGRANTRLTCDEVEGFSAQQSSEEGFNFAGFVFRRTESEAKWVIPPGPWGIFPGIPGPTALLGLVISAAEVHYTSHQRVDLQALLTPPVLKAMRTASEDFTGAGPLGSNRRCSVLLVLWDPDGNPKAFPFGSWRTAGVAAQSAILGPIAYQATFSQRGENVHLHQILHWGWEDFPVYRTLSPAFWKKLRGLVQEGGELIWGSDTLRYAQHDANMIMGRRTRGDLPTIDATIQWWNEQWGGPACD